jgi:long-chain fatty acid transport protein
MKSGIRRAVLNMAVVAAVASPAAFATNGYFTEGEGSVNRGMAGAGVAFAGDSLTMAVNPAGLVKVGNRFDVALGIFIPDRSETITGNGFGLNSSLDGNEDNPFYIPTVGYSSKIDANSAWGISAYGHGGMNTNYANNPLQVFPGGASYNLGVDLMQAFVNATYSRTVSPGVSLGIAALLVHQRFEAFGLQPFDNATFSASPGNVTNLGHDSDTGFGARVGVLWDVSNTVSLGAAYQSKITSKFEDYKGLFADGGEFNVPSTYTVGVAFKVSPAVDIALDWARINYTDSKSVSNPSSNPAQFGASGGPGFGWDDIDVIKLGAQMKGSGGWTWRAGWNHGDNPIGPEDAFLNILAPGVVQDHLNVGFSKALDKSSDINFVYLHAFKEEVTGPISAGFGGGSVTIEMEQDYIELGYSKRF